MIDGHESKQAICDLAIVQESKFFCYFDTYSLFLYDLYKRLLHTLGTY